MSHVSPSRFVAITSILIVLAAIALNANWGNGYSFGLFGAKAAPNAPESRPAKAAGNVPNAAFVSRTWDGGGATNNWSEAANWSSNTVPGSGDVAIFDGTSAKNATIDAGFAGSVSGLQIGAGYTGSITQASGTNLSVSSGYSQAGGTFTGGNGNLFVETSFSLIGGTLNAPSGTLRLWALNSGDPATFGGAATFNHNNGTVEFAGGNGNLSAPASMNFGNVTLNKNGGGQLGFLTTSTLVVTGSLTLTDGTVNNNGGTATIEAQSAVSIASTFDGGSATLLINGAATRTVTWPVGALVPALTVNAPNVTLNTSGAGTISFTQPLSVTSVASFTNGSVNFSFDTPFTLTAAMNFTHGSGALTFLQTYTQTSGTFTPGSGTIHFDGSFSLTGGTFNAPSTGTMTFFLFNGESFAVNGGTFNHNNGTVAFTGGNMNFTVPATLTFGNFILNPAGGGQLGFLTTSTLVIIGTLNLTDGSISGNGTVEAQGAVSIAPTFDGGSATLLIDGAATRTVTWPVGALVPALTVNAPNVTLNTSGAGNFTFTQPLTVTSAAAFTNGAASFTFNIPFTLTAAMNFTPGSGNLTFINTYTQTSGTFTPGGGAIHFDQTFSLTGGTFNAPSTGTMTFFLFNGESFAVNGGTFNHNNGTVAFTGGNMNFTVPATLTFGNFILNPSGGGQLGFLTTSTLVVTGTLTLTDGTIINNPGTGTIEAQGAVTIASTFDGGNVNLIFGGSADQAFANNGGPNLTGTWTVDKPAGTVTANTDLILGTGQPLNITSGRFLLASGSDLTCGALTVGTNGRLVNSSSTTITLGGNVVNSGVVDLQGGGAACPDPDTVLLRSTSATQRLWTGSGHVRLADVDVQSQGGTAPITVYNGTNTGSNAANWTFNASCSIPFSISPASVNVSAGGTQTFTANGTFTQNGTFSIPVNNSGGSIGSSSGIYTAGVAGVIDTVRVTNVFGDTADATVNVYTPIPSELAFQIQPSNTTAGQAISPSVTVRVLDQFANFMPGATNAVTVAIANNPGSSTPSGTLTRNAISGIATFNDLSLNRTGTGYTLAATSGILTGATSSGFTITPAAPAQLAFTVQPGTAVAGVNMFPGVQVSVLDAFGNLTIAGPSITLSIGNNPGGSTLSGFPTQNASSGVASFSIIRLNRPGTGYTLIASSSGLTAGSSDPFDVNVGAPSGLGFVTQPADTAPGSVISPPVTVAVQDSEGNTIPGATNAITIATHFSPEPGTLTGTLTRNAISGVATFNDLRIDTFGDGYVLKATTNGFGLALSDPFLIGTRRIITNTNDSGAGSLRQALIDGNVGTGKQLIEFAIPGSPPFIIALNSLLPIITRSAVIDGTTQPGFAGNPVVEVRSAGATLGLHINAPNCTVKGLSLTNFPHSAWSLRINSDGNIIKGNHIGVAADGSALGNQGGILVLGNNNLVGGATVTDRNVVSASQSGLADGIAVVGDNNVIEGNFIGTDPNGVGGGAFSNGRNGICLCASQGVFPTDNLIKDNVVSGNLSNGIAFNDNQAVFGNRLMGNRVLANARLGIALGSSLNAPLPNDPSDADTGANNRQNYPELTSVVLGVGNTTINGSLNSTPSSTLTLEFFSNPSCDPSGHGEGETYLGFANVITPASGLVGFTANLPVSVPSGRVITATATDASGNTSEFSQCRGQSHSISGTITDNLAAPLANVTLTVTGSSSATVLTNSQGNYSIPNLPAGGNYTVTPTRNNYIFSPLNRTYSNLSADQTGQNFTGTRNSGSITGTVTSIVVNATGGNGNPITATNGLAGATVSLTGAVTASTTTDGNGRFSFSNLPAGSYTVTPSRANFTMTPPSAGTTLVSNQTVVMSFTAQNPFTGRVAFVSGTSLRGMNADGSSIATISSVSRGSISSPSILNSKIVFSRTTYQSIPFPPVTIYSGGIFTVNFDGTGLTQLTSRADSSNRIDSSPIWMPSAGKIAFLRSSSTVTELFVMNNNGTSQVRVIAGAARNPTAFQNRIAFARPGVSNTSNIFAVDSDGTDLSQLTTNGASAFPVYSRDGLTILFQRSGHIFKMNADGSGQTLLVTAPSGHIFTPETFSPDGTRFAYSDFNVATGRSDIVSVTAGGTGPVLMAAKLVSPNPDWGFSPSASTGGFGPLGSSTVQLGGVTVTFTDVSVNGETVANPIPPYSAGDIPSGFVIGDLAYDIATSATFTPPVDVCFTVPDTEATTTTAFNRLYLMHSESGVLVDRTTSRDFGTRQIYATTTTTDLGAYSLAEQVDSLLPMITGLVVDSGGNPMSDVTMNLTGEESRAAVTDSDGLFHFVNLTMNGNYNVQPNQIGYVFEEYSKDFLDITTEQTVVFTGTASNVTISGRVTDEAGAGMADITLSLSGSGSDETVTDVNGDYSFLNVPVGETYFVGPVHDELLFTPAEAIIENLVSDASGVDFSLSLPGTISGTVTYGNAIGNPAPPRFVKNVSLSSTSGAPAVGPVITGTPGTYTLKGFGTGSYTIKPTKPGGSNGAITSNDAARVAQGVSGAVLFVSQNQRFAADASGNGNVTSNDAALIARFAVGLTGSGNSGQWKFFVTGAPSPLPTPPQTYEDSRSFASVTSDLTGEDFVGLLVGEVSGNYNPATHPRPVGSRQEREVVGSEQERTIDVKLPQVVLATDKEIVIPVNVEGVAGKEIISYEFDLRYDQAVLQPLENSADVAGTVSRGLMVVVNPNAPGLLRVVVYGAMPIDRDGVLLNLRFIAVGLPGSTGPLSFERIMFNEGEPRATVRDGRIELVAEIPTRVE